MAQTLANAADSADRSAAARPASRLRVYALLALGIVCIAFSAILTRWSGVPGTVSAFYRVAIAAVALGPLFGRGVARGRVALPPRLWLLAAGAGIFFALDLALWNTSLFMTSAATATLLGNDAPIIVGLGTLLIFRERLGAAFWLGLALALVGMGIIAGREVLAGATSGLGDALAALAGASYGGYLLVTGRIRARMDTLSTLWISCAAGTVLLLAVNLIAGHALWGFSTRVALTLLALGLISQVFGWLAINYALGHLPASVVSVTLLGQPVLTALFAVPLLSQPLGANQLLGGAVALGGIYLVNRGFARGKA
ncbi:MAG TPA: DMT family transporter [Ktedonobacterales bacterium]|nr:DMT family transporter [Ktedonobacterales bacterium]